MNKLSPSLRRWLLPSLLVLSAFAGAVAARAAEVIPEVPTRYFNDYALTVRQDTNDRLNRELEDFERQTSNQFRVVIYPKMQSDSDLADYCQRVARSWKVGEKGIRNGAILFVFVQDHKMNIQVGQGLEGVLPDATCKDILADKVRPFLKAGDYDGGLTAGVEAMMQAAKGEYQGSGKTEYEKQHPGGDNGGGGLGLGTIIFLIVLVFFVSRFFRGSGGGGLGYGGVGPVLFGGGGGFGGGFGGGGSSDGGRGSSDGGGFASSGGGDFGGGGASSDW